MNGTWASSASRSAPKPQSDVEAERLKRLAPQVPRLLAIEQREQRQRPERVAERDQRAGLDRIRRHGDRRPCRGRWRGAGRGGTWPGICWRSPWPPRPWPRGGSSGTCRARRGRSRKSASRSRCSARDRRYVRVEIAVHESPYPPRSFATSRTGAQRGRFHPARRQDRAADEPPLDTSSAWRAKRARTIRASRSRWRWASWPGVLSIVPPLAFRDHHQPGARSAAWPVARPHTRSTCRLVMTSSRSSSANAAIYGQTYLTAWSGQHLVARLRVRLFERLLNLPLGEFDKWRPGELIARFSDRPADDDRRGQRLACRSSSSRSRRSSRRSRR